MTPSDEKPPTIREDDVEARSIQRRTFLGRFVAVAGIAGLAGWTTACGSESDSVDSDFGDPADADPTDPADFDTGDPADSD